MNLNFCVQVKTLSIFYNILCGSTLYQINPDLFIFLIINLSSQLSFQLLIFLSFYLSNLQLLIQKSIRDYMGMGCIYLSNYQLTSQSIYLTINIYYLAIYESKSMHLSIYLPIYYIYLSSYLSMQLSSVGNYLSFLYLNLCIFLSISLLISLSIFLSISLSVSLAIFKSMYLSIYICIYLSIYLAIHEGKVINGCQYGQLVI